MTASAATATARATGTTGQGAYHRSVEPVGVTAVERLVAEALDGLPTELADLMDNVVVLTADRGDPPDLLGLYDGIPLTQREDYGGLAMPDRLLVYRLSLSEVCADVADLRHEVAVTVVHEVAHHFGIDDDTLDGLGWA